MLPASGRRAASPAGGQLRNNLDARIAVGKLDRDGVLMMFGSGVDPEVRLELNGVKGRALVAHLSAGAPDLSVAQIYFVDEDDQRLVMCATANRLTERAPNEGAVKGGAAVT